MLVMKSFNLKLENWLLKSEEPAASHADDLRLIAVVFSMFLMSLLNLHQLIIRSK